MDKAQIGVIGLGAMGASLARNFASRDIPTVVYNRTTEKTEKYIAEFGSEHLAGSDSLEDFINKLKTPRRILIMVKSGGPVNAVIEQLIPLLDQNDILIDGGNSNYKVTEAKEQELSTKGINFIGMGISGGEEGALKGPSMMPGGKESAYQEVAPMLQKIAAPDGLGGTCVTYIGPSGSGHFVKTVHNGIEYAIMQLIAESYDLLHRLGDFTNDELAATFTEWNSSPLLESFLIEITAKIFAKKDESGTSLIDLIKDTAKQKGTGKWTSFAAFDYGVSTPTINAAVDARIMSGDYEMRQKHSKDFPVALTDSAKPNKEELKTMVQHALELSTIASYIQGLELIKKANEEHNWNLNLSEIARIWRGGCIIRSVLLDKFQRAYSDDEVAASGARQEILTEYADTKQKNWRQLITLATNQGIPIPCTSSALTYYDAMRTARLPQNLTQAQRDFFGAHTFERLDQEGTFHVDWE